MHPSFNHETQNSKTTKRVVIAGACGMGMLPLVILLKQSGVDVIASDDGVNERVMGYFDRLNIPFVSGDRLPECDVFVHTSAIKRGHPLYQQALDAGVRIYRRGEYFAEFVKGKKLIAIIGSHGKTTTAAVLIQVLKHIGFDFSYYLGGLFQDPEVLPAHYSSTSEWLVAEIDESDGTIGLFDPEMTVLLNLSWDHSSFYRDVTQLHQTFTHLLQRTRSKVFMNAEEPSLKVLSFSGDAKLAVCSLKKASEAILHADFREDASGFVRLDLGKGFNRNESIVTYLRGEFNARNVLIALSVAAMLSDKSFEDVLEGFLGVSRRQEVLYADDSRVVVTDYAHHPNEVAAFLNDARRRYAGRKIVTLFQPHRYSRTRQYAMEFAQILASMGSVHILSVYGASEAECEEGKAERIYEKMQLVNADVTFWSDAGLLLNYLQSVFVEDTVILFVGAGDIERVARNFSAQYVRDVSSKKLSV
jgi:UDP-N-acetylmuramate--alanine ligase